MTSYTRVLVARHSPQNRCFAAEGELLTVLPRKKLGRMRDLLRHNFISACNPKLTSRYGWVGEHEPFTLDEFLQAMLGKSEVSQDEREHISTMLASISGMPVGLPVAAGYSCRGVMEKRMVFIVHRVFFYPAKKGEIR
jgi:hypothetical protein